MSLFRFLCAFVLLFAIIGVTPAVSQEYPNKEVHVIIPYNAGGSTDMLGRVVFDKVAQNMGAVFVVENKAGAGGQIAQLHMVKSAPDGYTLSVDGNPPFIQPAVMSKMPYDWKRDFAFVAYVASMPSVVVVPEKSPIKSVKELFAYAKDSSLTIGCSAMGNLSYFAGQMLAGAAGGDDIVIATYKGSSQVIIDMLSGNVDLAIDNMPAYISQIRAGNLRVLAVTTEKRSPELPDVPTMIESGYPQFNLCAKFGVFAPAGTPKSIIEKLSREIIAAVKSADVEKILMKAGFEPTGMGPEKYEQIMTAEADQWLRVAKERNIPKVDR